jgi:hypothetical protein
MRRAMLLLAVLGLVSTLWAADPLVGTWKLSIAKSKFAPGQEAAIKELTIVNREVGADLETTFEGIGANGSPFSIKFTCPLQGGLLKSAQASTEGTFVVITVIEPGNMYGTSVQNGKQVEVTHTFVSKDRKTATRTSKAVDAQGKITETVLVLEKK